MQHTELKYAQLKIECLRPNPLQPRQHINQAALQKLSETLSHQGVIQPILVRPSGAGLYEIVAGERRWRAAKLLGWKHIPAIIKDIPTYDLLEVGLIENIQRAELSPIDEAKALQTLIKNNGYTQEQLALRLGKDRSTITNALRLLKLPRSVQVDLDYNRLSSGQARALLAVEDDALQRKLADQIITEQLSVREVESLIRKTKRHSVVKPQPSAKRGQYELYRDRVEEWLGTQVVITNSGRGGSISLKYYSENDLMRLLEKLLPENQD